MSFRLVDKGWGRLLDDALRLDHATVRVVCPFIKQSAAQRLLRRGDPRVLQVITRFNLDDFSNGVSDTAALRLLLEAGGQIRGVRGLHAKLYLFGARRAIVTSANLTEAALLSNHEFGFVAEDPKIVGRCHEYFDEFWERAGDDLTSEKLENWDEGIARYLSGVTRSTTSRLGDEGVDARIMTEAVAVPAWVEDGKQAFVKLYGEGNSRVPHATPVLTEVDRSGCHWACTYPANKRPRSVRDGAIMFMGRMVFNPDDIVVYGRAVGLQYRPGRDDATNRDIKKRDWKAKWPRYIRVHHAEFVDGILENGVSLFELMDALGSNAFASTKHNAAIGVGNINPRHAYRQQPQVQLAPEGLAWLNERLEQAFDQYGRLPPAKLERLDWPAVPRG